jgi:hypothetical protein
VKTHEDGGGTTPPSPGASLLSKNVFLPIFTTRREARREATEKSLASTSSNSRKPTSSPRGIRNSEITTS